MGWWIVLFLIGLISVGLAMATISLDSGQSDDEEDDKQDDEDTDLGGLTPFDQDEEDARDIADDAEVVSGSDGDNSDEHTSQGTSGKDLIFSQGSDGAHFSVVHGNDGNDRIYASDGADVFGGAGNDMIVLRNTDGEGYPVEVSGDEGEDVFLVELGDLSAHMGNIDTITDYHAGEDILGVILEDEDFSDGTVDGSLHFSMKEITAETRADGTLVTISITRELDPDSDTAGGESTTDLTHQVFLKGAQSFDPSDVVILKDWVTFAKDFLGPEEYSSVIYPEK